MIRIKNNVAVCSQYLFMFLDCWNIPHGKITNETGPNMATPTIASNHYDAQSRSMFQNWPSRHYSPSNADQVY